MIDFEWAAHLVILLLAYALGCAAGLYAPRLVGVSGVAGAAVWLAVLLPLIVTLTVEALTGFWKGTPGAFGLGSLTAVLPLALAGLASGVAALVFGRFVEPYPYHFSRDHASLMPWIGLALALSLLALALWRWWPEPRARLW